LIFDEKGISNLEGVHRIATGFAASSYSILFLNGCQKEFLFPTDLLPLKQILDFETWCGKGSIGQISG